MLQKSLKGLFSANENDDTWSDYFTCFINIVN